MRKKPETEGEHEQLFNKTSWAAYTGCAVISVLLSEPLTTLAAMPTRYTIPAFALGLLMDLCVIIISLLAH